MDYEMYMDFKAIYAEERKHSIYTGFLESYPSSPRLEVLMNNLTGHELKILSKTTINSTKNDIQEYIQILQRVVENIPDNNFPWNAPNNTFKWNTPKPINNNPWYGQNRQYQLLNQTAVSDELYYDPKVISESFAKKLENDLPDKMNVNPSYDDYLLNVTPIKDQDKTCVMCRSTPVNLDSQTGRESEHKSDDEHDNTTEPDYSETQKILSDKQRLSTTNTVNGSIPNENK